MYNFDPYNVLLSIATNTPVLLMTDFVLQGHIFIISLRLEYRQKSSVCCDRWLCVCVCVCVCVCFLRSTCCWILRMVSRTVRVRRTSVSSCWTSMKIWWHTVVKGCDLCWYWLVIHHESLGLDVDDEVCVCVSVLQASRRMMINQEMEMISPSGGVWCLWWRRWLTWRRKWWIYQRRRNQRNPVSEAFFSSTRTVLCASIVKGAVEWKTVFILA